MTNCTSQMKFPALGDLRQTRGNGTVYRHPFLEKQELLCFQTMVEEGENFKNEYKNRHKISNAARQDLRNNKKPDSKG